MKSGDYRPAAVATKAESAAVRSGAGDCERDTGANARAHVGSEFPAMNSGPKWSLRNGAQYRRLCARPGCGAAAVATLRFQSTQRQAWLVELDVNASRTQGDLCQRHAAALVLPRGWELHDERTPGAWTAVGASGSRAKSAAKSGTRARKARARRKKPAADAEPADAALPGFEPDAPVAAEPAVAPEVETPAAVVVVTPEVVAAVVTTEVVTPEVATPEVAAPEV